MAAAALASASAVMERASEFDQALTPRSLLDTVDRLAVVGAASPPEVRLFLCLLAAYPTALMWRSLPRG
eukprot:IDg12517t1